MNKYLLGKVGLFAIAFLALFVSPAFAVTNFTTTTGNLTTAPVNIFQVNLLQMNNTLNVTQVNFTLSTGLSFVSTTNVTNSTFAGFIYGSTISFGNNTTNSSSRNNLFAFNVSASMSGLFNITVTEVSNNSGLVTNVTLNVTNGTINLANDTFANFTYNGTALTLNFTGTPSALTPTGGGLIVDNITFTLYMNATSSANYTNYTSNGTGKVSYSAVSAGIYNFTFNTSGTANYSANSTSIILNISQAVPSLSIFVNNSYSNANSTVVYPAPVEIRGNATLGNATVVPMPTFNVYVINTSASSPAIAISTSGNPAVTTQILGNASYQVIYNTTGNQNFTSASNSSIIFNVNKGTTLSISITGTNSSSYPTSPYVNGTRNSSNIGDADVNYTLWRNGTLASSANGASVSDTTILSAMIFYMYTFNATGGTNWTSDAGGVNTTVNVTKGTPTLMLNISPSTSVTNPTQTNATGYNCPSIPGASDVNCTLWRNSVYVESDIAKNMSDVSTRDTGNWVYNFSTEGGANWTSNYTTLTLTVSAAASSFVSGGGGGYSSPVTKVTVTRGNAAITVPSIAAQSMASVTIAKMDDVAFRQINISVANSVNNIKIVITKLPGLPASVTHGITGKVYNYIEVDETNFTNADVSNVYIKFAVNKTWLTDNGVDASDISLYRWANNQWNELATTYVSSDSYEAFYQVQSPGMSFFLIGTKGGEATAVVTTCTESWTCGAWSDCANSVQTRACTDANNCGTTINKPAVSQSCVLGPVAAVDYTWLYAAGIIIILIIAAVVLSKVTKPSSKK